MTAALAGIRIGSHDDFQTAVLEHVQKGDLQRAFGCTEKERKLKVSELTEIEAKQLEVAKIILAERDPQALFVDADFKPTENLQELLKLDGIDPNSPLGEIKDITQKTWLQVVQGQSVQSQSAQSQSAFAQPATKGTVERTDLRDDAAKLAKKEKIESIAKDRMKLFDKRDPALSHYKYGGWLGALLTGVRGNLHSLVEAWKQGVRFDHLVVFTGERDLRKEDGQEDDIKKLCDPTQSPLPFKKDWKLPDGAKYDTEHDMMRLVFDQVQLPEDMEAALKGKVTFINATKSLGKRPGTKECYVKWLKEHDPEPGAILAPGYPLLWSYQQIAGANVLGSSYPLDMSAPAFAGAYYEHRKHNVVSVIQDTFAKCIFELNNRLEARKSKVIALTKADEKKSATSSD